jgi:hypothetical protein
VQLRGPSTRDQPNMCQWARPASRPADPPSVPRGVLVGPRHGRVHTDLPEDPPVGVGQVCHAITSGAGWRVVPQAAGVRRAWRARNAGVHGALLMAPPASRQGWEAYSGHAECFVRAIDATAAGGPKVLKTGGRRRPGVVRSPGPDDRVDPTPLYVSDVLGTADPDLDPEQAPEEPAADRKPTERTDPLTGPAADPPTGLAADPPTDLGRPANRTRGRVGLRSGEASWPGRFCLGEPADRADPPAEPAGTPAPAEPADPAAEPASEPAPRGPRPAAGAAEPAPVGRHTCRARTGRATCRADVRR